MNYKYHVDVSYDYGNHESTHTYKFCTFGEAFELFTEKVEFCRARRSTLAWSVSIYDMDAMRLRMNVNESDFE